jgi:hypothetical protein
MLVLPGTQNTVHGVRGTFEACQSLFTFEIVSAPNGLSLPCWTSGMDDGPGGPIICFPRGIVAAAFYMEGLICFGVFWGISYAEA